MFSDCYFYDFMVSTGCGKEIDLHKVHFIDIFCICDAFASASSRTISDLWVWEIVVFIVNRCLPYEF